MSWILLSWPFVGGVGVGVGVGIGIIIYRKCIILHRPMEFLLEKSPSQSAKTKTQNFQKHNKQRKKQKQIYSFLQDGKHTVWMIDPLEDLLVHSRISKRGNIYRNLQTKKLDKSKIKRFFVQVMKDMDQYCGNINPLYLEKLYYENIKNSENLFVYITKKSEDRDVVVAFMVFKVGFFYQDMESNAKLMLSLDLICSNDPQKKGYGSYLMKLLEDIAEVMNIDMIQIPEAVGDQNRDFYASKGYQVLDYFEYIVNNEKYKNEDEAKKNKTMYLMQKELHSTPLGSLTSPGVSPSPSKKSVLKQETLFSRLTRRLTKKPKRSHGGKTRKLR